MRWLVTLGTILFFSFAVAMLDRNSIPLAPLEKPLENGRQQPGTEKQEANPTTNVKPNTLPTPDIGRALQNQESIENSEHRPAQQDSKWTDSAQAVSAVAIAVLTCILIVINIIQLRHIAKTTRSAKKAAKTAEKALTIGQRAFVFANHFQSDFLNDKLIILAEWRNSGATPTRFMTNYVNWRTWDSDPPLDYGFPNLDREGNIVAEDAVQAVPMHIGPNASMWTEPVIIPTEVLDGVVAKRLRVLIWGWAKYQDVFNVPHITKFCQEIIVLASERSGDQVKAAVKIVNYHQHNCADEECG